MMTIRLFSILLLTMAAYADIRIPGPPPPSGGWTDLIAGIFLSLAAFLGGFRFWRRSRRNRP
jgi:hypothetical protein